ncbi:TPA: hypothetical protein ACUI23_001627 [Staphylococcus pseudintermedius]
MNSSLLTKLLAAGVILTSVSTTTNFGSAFLINHEAHAQEENPNKEHFKKTVEGQELDFTDTLNRNKLTPKDLSDEISKELKEKGLMDDYKFNLKVSLQNGGTIEGAGTAGQVPSNQSAEFDPTKDKITVFEISK